MSPIPTGMTDLDIRRAIAAAEAAGDWLRVIDLLREVDYRARQRRAPEVRA